MSKSQKKSKALLKILRKKSKKGLDLARRTMLKERIVSNVIRRALEYYVTHWQILTHPAPFLIAYETVGGNPNRAYEAQASIAMLAAAVDIHDDIIDGSKTKHGTPTIAGKFGNDVALLLGNAFFINGLTLLAQAAGKLLTNKTEEVLQVAKRGLFKTGDAHAMEFSFRRKLDVDPEEYMRILEMKAAATAMSIELGAMLGGGTKKEIRALGNFGEIFGTLEGLREEFIDIFEREELNNRVQNECLPLPVLYALQSEKSTEIRRILSSKEMDESDVSELLDLVLESKNVKELRKRMETMIERANEDLSNLRNSESRSLFTELLFAATEDL